MSAPSHTHRVEISAQARHEDRVGQRTSSARSLLVINNLNVFRHEAALFVSVVGSGDSGAVTDLARTTRGQVSLSFVVPFVAGHRYYGAAPAATVSAPLGWTGGTRTGSGPWTYTYLADASTTAVAAAPDFGFTFIALSDAGSGPNSPHSITVNASAPSGAGSATDEA